jgi:hypothetical protein
MYRGDIKMIKNTEVQYTRREAKLIAEILDAARSEFYKDKDERSGSFKYFSDSDIEKFSSYYQGPVHTTEYDQASKVRTSLGADTHRGRRRLARSRNRKASTLSGLFFACANEIGTPLALFALLREVCPLVILRIS